MAQSKTKPAKSAASPKAPSKSSPTRRSQATKHAPPAHRARRTGTSTAAAAKTTRKAQLIVLLTRPKGARLDELVAATGWQLHSVRASLAHFKREGHTVTREVDAQGASHYHLTLA